MYRSRLLKECSDAAKIKDENFFLYVNDSNLYKWEAYLVGPDDSPYNSGVFLVKI